MGRQQPGNAVIEYGFVAVVVLVAAIAILANVLGPQLREWLTGVHGDMTGSIAAAEAYQASKTEFGQALQAAGIPSDQVCFDNNRGCFSIPVVNNTTLATSGSNGGTLIGGMADVLNQIARRLKADPEADADLTARITALAAKGHLIGGDTSKVIDKCKSNCGSARDDLKSLRSNTTEFTSMYDSLKSYIAARPQSLPPEYWNMIQKESGSIIEIAKSYDIKEKKSGGFLGIGKKTSFNLGYKAPPETVHQDANTVCSSGGNTSQCIYQKSGGSGGSSGSGQGSGGG